MERTYLGASAPQKSRWDWWCRDCGLNEHDQLIGLHTVEATDEAEAVRVARLLHDSYWSKAGSINPCRKKPDMFVRRIRAIVPN